MFRLRIRLLLYVKQLKKKINKNSQLEPILSERKPIKNLRHFFVFLCPLVGMVVWFHVQSAQPEHSSSSICYFVSPLLLLPKRSSLSLLVGECIFILFFCSFPAERVESPRMRKKKGPVIFFSGARRQSCDGEDAGPKKPKTKQEWFTL